MSMLLENRPLWQLMEIYLILQGPNHYVESEWVAEHMPNLYL